jgi:hypothetical protein
VNTATASQVNDDGTDDGRLLLAQIKLRREQDWIFLDGFAFDFGQPKTKIKIIVEDLLGTTQADTTCDGSAPGLIDGNFIDGKLGFTLALACPEGPFPTLRIRVGTFEIFRHLPAANFSALRVPLSVGI